MRTALLALIAVTFLAGCELYGPSVKVTEPRLKVDGVHDDHHDHYDDDHKEKGKFCPPGQAKKGNC